MDQGKESNNRPAIAAGDDLSGQVAIRANIDSSGLTVAGKSRALSAADRLLGGLIGIPAAYVEGFRARIEANNRVREELIRTEGKRAIELLRDMDETGKATARRFIAEETRKQINREAVWAETEKSIHALPPPIPAAAADERLELDEDWINIFASYAEKASSARLRQLWGAILAGEIRQSGSFSPSTLRVISEIDAEIATAFQDVASLRLGDGKVLKPEPFEGAILIRWTFLEEVGLLQDVNGPLHVTYSEFPQQNSVFEMTHNYYLKITMTDRAKKVVLPFVRITRVGQQIASILPWDELAALKLLANRMKEDVGLEIGRQVDQNPTGFRAEVIEIIRPPGAGQT